MDEGAPIQTEDQTPIPWFRGSKDVEPFTLCNVIASNDSPPFHTTATFPWVDEIIETPEDQAKWNAMVNHWKGTVLVGSTGCIFIFRDYGCRGPPQSYTLRDESGNPLADWKVLCVAWSFARATSQELLFRPLAVFSASSVIFVLDLAKKELIGCIRGHGGEITSITIHPQHTNYLCTTSRDMTSRLYDLSLKCRQKPNNTHWLPNKNPSMAGPAFGLMHSGPEGSGNGCSVAVFVGGRSGGHLAGVLGASFHPISPLIATCGMDRCIKIWYIPDVLGQHALAREDKPIFSTDLIHKSRVRSVQWLSPDVLISYSAPALMRKDPKNRTDLYEEAGTVVVWRWLGYDRFFPPSAKLTDQPRGIASDYRGSETFKIVACYALPLVTPSLRLFKSVTHDPIILIPMGKIIRVINVAHLTARSRPEFPPDIQERLEEDLVPLAKRIRLDPTAASGSEYSSTQNTVGTQNDGSTQDEEGDEDRNEVQGVKTLPVYPKTVPPRELFQAVEGWDVRATNPKVPLDLADIEDCEVACGGSVIIGVGKKGTMFVWKRLRPSS